MIFRALYTSKLRRLFGEFVAENAIMDVVSSISEWKAFKLLMPFRVESTAMTHAEAMAELKRTIDRSLDEQDNRRAF